MNYKIIAVTWFHEPTGVEELDGLDLGVIALKLPNNKWQAHMAVIRKNWDDGYKVDRLLHTTPNFKLSPAEAMYFFPDQKLTTYDYFTDLVTKTQARKTKRSVWQRFLKRANRLLAQRKI